MMALSKVFNSMKGGGIAKGIIEIGLVIAAFGAINEIVKKFGGDAVSFMESGGEILGAIGRGIGSFIKGIIGDMLPKVDLPTLPELGMQLSLFMVSAKGFIDGAKQVDGSALAGVGYLAAAIIAIGAAEVVNAILTLFGGDDPIVAFAGQLETLGGGLLKYATSIKGFSSAASPEDISSSIETAKGLADINTALPATGGKLQDWLGTKDLGLAGGIDAYASAVSTSSANAGNKAIDSAKLMLANLTGLLASGIDAAPTIRPVLDLSDVQNGIGTMNGMFSSQRSFGMSMFGGGSFVRGANALNFDGAKIVGGMSNKDVVTEIRNLNSRFNELTDAVSNMQLVLDTGVLVGQTSAKMDRQLGIQASRKGRGN